MDYTANYHLPQWEKSDRIMMDDFNAAMADVEAGLNRVRAGSEGGLGAVNSDLARIHAVAQDLARDTYRRAVLQRLAHGSLDRLDSVWYNGLYSAEEAGSAWAGDYGLHLGGRMATEAGIRAAASNTSYICTLKSTSYQSRYAALQFYSDGYGILQDIKLFSESNASGTFPLYIVLRRADNGMLIRQAGPFAPEATPGSSCYYMRRVNFPLVPGVPYLMEISVPEGAAYFAIAGFLMASPRFPSDVSQKMTILPLPTAASVSKTLAPPDWAQSGILLLRWAGDGSVTPAVNGGTLPGPARTRASTNAWGNPCQETDYLIESLPEGPLEPQAEAWGANARSIRSVPVVLS